MNLKEAATVFIFKVVIPTIDVATDWLLGYHLITGWNFDLQCSDFVAENHVNMGIAILVPVIVAALFTIHHWYHFEKVENGGSGRLRTLPFVVSQTWTQFRYLKLIWSGVVKRNKKAWQREKEFLDREIATVKAWVENMPQIVSNLNILCFCCPIMFWNIGWHWHQYHIFLCQVVFICIWCFHGND